MQYAALEDVPVFKIRADEGASKEAQQNLIVGASTVAHMMKAVCNREEGETAMYYMSKPGSTLDDMYKALKKVLEEKSFFLLDDKCDPEVKKAGKRPLMILVVMTLNDLNAIMDAEYLTDSLESFRLLTTRFETCSGRKTKLSFTQYMYAPSRRDNHVKIAEMNAIIEKANTEIFSTATYDPNTRLLRPVKTGRPGNVTVIKSDGTSDNYHTTDTSMTGNWILPGAYHVADKKLREITKDVRVFFNLAMQESNPKPWDAYDMDVEIDVDDVLPKFDPTDEYPSLASASLYANKASARNDERREERAPGERVLGDFLEQAEEQGGRQGAKQDRDGAKRSRQGRDREENSDRRKRREESLEDRRQQARQLARQRTKERIRAAKNSATEEKWQEIKDKAEAVRPPVDARVHIEGDVANMSVEGEKEEGDE